MPILTGTEKRVDEFTEYLLDNSTLTLSVTNYFNNVRVLSKNNEPYIVIKYFSDDSRKIHLHSKGFKIISTTQIELHDGRDYVVYSIEQIQEEYDNDKLFGIMTVYSCWYLREFIEDFELQKVLDFMKF